ncbi:MAG: ABC transporter ATP-binding protein [Proteobacteria bacterium]|nr:MAG: ABC transporter ATP-binding protein [Pseudomonadota bacterium]
MSKEMKPSIITRLKPYMGEKRYLFPLSFVLSACSAVLGLLPFVFIWLITRAFFSDAPVISVASGVSDTLTEPAIPENVSLYAWLTLGSAFLAMLLYFFALLASHLAAFRVEVGMRKVAMHKIISMPQGFFGHYQTGKIRKVIDDNASQTHAFLAHQLPDLASTVIAPLVLLLLIVAVDWRMGLVTLVPVALGIGSMSFMMTKEGERFRNLYMDALEEMSSEAVEYVRGIPVVKTFGQSVYAFKRFVGSITRYREMVITFTLMWSKPMSFYTAIMQSTAFFLVPFSVLFISYGENPALILSSFVFYLLISPGFTLLFMRSMYFQNYADMTRQVLDRFDNLLDYPQMVFLQDGQKPDSYDIEFKDVIFAYEGAQKNAVDGISFTVRQGETVALVGASGSGKTTIARLAVRFRDVQSGAILIGGINIQQLSQKDLMDSIALVFQNTRLFNKSLRDNIVYGKPEASEEEIQRAIDLSQSRDIIDHLPMGLDTVIGKQGAWLSGGEQQRIALARAILKDSPIVILDEATAFADPENEHSIQLALRELRKDKTGLMIAHRMTTVQHADKILVIDAGKIVEQGTHDELLAKEGAYTQMWQEYQQSIRWKIRKAERF